MRVSLFIALRYLISRRKGNAANIISIISIIGVTVSTAGLIIVLSVFNGFSGIVMSLYDSFDPDISIRASEGKTLVLDQQDSTKIWNTEGVSKASFVLEENALLRAGEKQVIATIKGVDSSYFKVSEVNTKVIDGIAVKNRADSSFAVFGAGLAYHLGVTPSYPMNMVTVHVPKKGKPVSLLMPEDAFNTGVIRPTAVFAIQQEFDDKYAIVPIGFAREVIGDEVAVSAIEIKVKDDASADQVQAALQKSLGPEFKVQTRIQQHEFLYKILKSEKWAVYLILSFILLIAVFNIAGSLNMLIIEKKRDIATLDSIGASLKQIKGIFMLEGALATMGGALIGMVIGFLICFAQQEFGIIKLAGGEGYLVENYPVEMQGADFLNVLILVVAIGLLAAIITSRKIAPGSPSKTGN
ncbi:MAG: FtsX-like permease family protein [Bacteroidota bacterium]